MSSLIEQAIRQVCEEKGLSYEAVIETIEAALASAYRKDYGDKEKPQNIEALFDPSTGKTRVFDVKTVVEDMDLEELKRQEEERRHHLEQVAKERERACERGEEMAVLTIGMDEDLLPRFNPKTDIMFSEAKELKPDAQVGEIIKTELPQPTEFGRMAAMTAKQVITQRLREAEREVVFHELKEKEGQVIQATVQRREGAVVLMDIGRVTGILRSDDQISSERYSPGDRLNVYIREVTLTNRGPQIFVSRTADELVYGIFEVEIPEVAEGSVQIKSIAREPGFRSKVAFYTEDQNIDPIGACIGQRGSRIQTIIMTLGGEKIDMIEWTADPVEFIRNALSPAKIQRVEIQEEERLARVFVLADQLSLAIGKGGQNVRLAARLTGWKINVSEAEVSEGSETKEETQASVAEEIPKTTQTEES